MKKQACISGFCILIIKKILTYNVVCFKAFRHSKFHMKGTLTYIYRKSNPCWQKVKSDVFVYFRPITFFFFCTFNVMIKHSSPKTLLTQLSDRVFRHFSESGLDIFVHLTSNTFCIQVIDCMSTMSTSVILKMKTDGPHYLLSALLNLKDT